MVRLDGFEPSRLQGQGILSPTCMPVPPQSHTREDSRVATTLQNPSDRFSLYGHPLFSVSSLYKWPREQDSNPRDLRHNRFQVYAVMTNFGIPRYGAYRENRTPNLLITNQLRYQLRHVGIWRGDPVFKDLSATPR